MDDIEKRRSTIKLEAKGMEEKIFFGLCFFGASKNVCSSFVCNCQILNHRLQVPEKILNTTPMQIILSPVDSLYLSYELPIFSIS